MSGAIRCGNTEGWPTVKSRRSREQPPGYGHGVGDNAQPLRAVFEDVDDLALVGRALTLVPDVETDDVDDHQYWTIVHEMHRRGTQLIFDEAAQMIRSDDPCARRVACDVLGQLGYDHGRPFDAETLPLLARVCTDEATSPILASVISAMGHLGRPDALAFVVAHATHSDASVRFPVACALPSIAGVEWLDPAHSVVTALMQLTSDEDADVRDWATFGLGTQVYVDGDAVRQCLFARVDDPDDDTRAEAIAGLARRRAPGILRHVRDALEAETVGHLTVVAAASLGDPSLAESLTGLAEWWDVDGDLLERARRRCDPGRIDATVGLISELFDAAEANHLRLTVASDLLDETGELDVYVGPARAIRTHLKR
jgi:HEAT repeats